MALYTCPICKKTITPKPNTLCAVCYMDALIRNVERLTEQLVRPKQHKVKIPDKAIKEQIVIDTLERMWEIECPTLPEGRG